MDWAIYNGAIIDQERAAALLRQPAYHASDSLIETMRWQDERIYLETWHRQRLFRSMQALGILQNFDGENDSFRLIKERLSAAGNESARIRLQIVQRKDKAFPDVLMTLGSLPEMGNAVKAGIATNLRKKRHPLSWLKNADRQIYSNAAEMGTSGGWDETLICNDAGRIIEATIANIFWMKGDTIYTPPLSEGCVAGVMRAYLLDALPKKGISVAEQPLTVEMLAQADEVFLTNALRGIRPVQTIEQLATYQYLNIARLSAELVYP